MMSARCGNACAMAKNTFLLVLVLLLPQLVFAAPPTEPRQTVSLNDGWSFRFGESNASVTSSEFDDSGWEKVSVPHTWNRIGEYGLIRSAVTNNKQGVGYYRLRYSAPAAAENKRHYLDFAAVGTIADVWVNGVHVGQHKGAFSRFRFDVTSAWKPGITNLIVVKADNSKPALGSSTEHVLPLAGDFFVHGGIYRGVQLITANDVGIDLLDFGGPGIYVQGQEDLWVSNVPNSYSGTIGSGDVLVRLRNFTTKVRKLRLRAHLLDATGQKVAHSKFKMTAPAQGVADSNWRGLFNFTGHRIWNGRADPYLYKVVVEVREGKQLLDRVTQPLGLRSFRFDTKTGFFLNGTPLKLKGVSRHQDRLGKGYALSREDHAEDMALIKEMGANSIRQAHYQHADEWSDEADKAGMVVWAEIPFVTTPSFTGGEGSPELFANAEQQTRELIRQNFNHPSIMMWSVGNEVDASTLFGVSKAPVKPLKLLKHINRIAREEDPGRPTIFADCCEDVRVSAMAGAEQVDKGAEKLAGVADLIGYNRYYGWYYPQPLKAAEQLGKQMDKFRAKHPLLPLSISEYGAGGAISQHSDNPTVGFINAIGRPQPEEYESWLHEQSWPAIRDRDFIFGSWVWNMFDFASDLRGEGDSVDINTKGLVTFDRKEKKDAFYYYKAQWSDESFIHITGKRYIDRAYSAMEVRAYSSEARAGLLVGSTDYGTIECPDHICVWPNVALAKGANAVKVSDGNLADNAVFNGPDPAHGIRLDAGDNAGRVLGAHRFGSDDFVTGGTTAILNQGGFGGRRSGPIRTVIAPEPVLYDYWREGIAFRYAVPLPDGAWTVSVHSFEPGSSITASETMSISADGVVVVPPFSIAKDAGGPLRGITKRFTVMVKGGLLKLDFTAQGGGKAVVAAIEFSR